MSLTVSFINWIHSYLGNHPQYQLLQSEIPNFDFAYKRSSSLRKGRQTHLYKVIPSNLTINQAQHFAQERKQLIDSRSSFIKLLQEFLIFFYITDVVIPYETLNYLASFSKPYKRTFKNVIVFNILLETYNGSFLIPDKTGFLAWRPIKKLRDEIRRDILEPYHSWRQSQIKEFPSY